MQREGEILSKILSGELSGASRREALRPVEGVGELLVSCAPDDYSASGLSRAVEDADMQLIGLWLTSVRDSRGRQVIVLQLQGADTPAAARSLERYGYEVLTPAGGATAPTPEEMLRAAELLRYLQI